MTISDAILYCFLSFLFINIFYHVFFFQRLIFFKSPKKELQKQLPVSVIVCAKNEAQNLKELIPLLVSQNYREFEIIIINDNSTDNSIKIIESFQKKHSNLKLVNVKNVEAFWGNKKYALTLGIKTALHNQLLFTDADCRPLHENWIYEMSSCFSDSHQIILGYSGYQKEKHTLLNKLIRYETLLTATQYLSYALRKRPYMGVGRNLAYKKSLFFKSNGFDKHMKLKSGDDDLFVNQNSNSKNTTINLHPNSFTVSIPKKSISEWLRQKRRHVSTSSYYKKTDQFLLGLFFVSQIGIWVTFILLLNTNHLYLGMLLMTSRLCLAYSILGGIAKKLDEKDLILYFILLEPLLIVSQLIIFTRNTISKPTHWN